MTGPAACCSLQWLYQRRIPLHCVRMACDIHRSLCVWRGRCVWHLAVWCDLCAGEVTSVCLSCTLALPKTFFITSKNDLQPPASLCNLPPKRARVSVGGGGGCQMTVSRGGGGGCKGISRQSAVPSTDARDLGDATTTGVRVERSHDPLQ